jgi:Ni,Fe-hydrogenase III large subunit
MSKKDKKVEYNITAEYITAKWGDVFTSIDNWYDEIIVRLNLVKNNFERNGRIGVCHFCQPSSNLFDIIF